jgi:streptogrisin B
MTIKKKFGISSIFVTVLLVTIVLVPIVSAEENVTKELTFGPDTFDVLKKDPNFIGAYGNIPAFSNQDDRKQWLDTLDKVYTKATKNFKNDMSKNFYPNGSVIAYGYTIDGVLQVTIKKGQKIDTDKENEIYNLFSNYGQELNVTNIPLTIVYGDLLVPTSRASYWRPLIGGIQLVSDASGGAVSSTLGFAAKTSSGTKGIVVVGHAVAGIGSSVYQPTSSYYVGSVTSCPEYDADAAWVPYTNVNAKIYDYDTDVTKTVKSYGNPSVGQYVYRSGITKGRTAGTITSKTSAYDSGIGRTLDDQYIAGYSCDYGDSGSPVYVFVTGGVKVLGIHWGGVGTHTSSGFSSGIFSSVADVHNELGVYPLTA